MNRPADVLERQEILKVAFSRLARQMEVLRALEFLSHVPLGSTEPWRRMDRLTALVAAEVLGNCEYICKVSGVIPEDWS